MTPHWRAQAERVLGARRPKRGDLLDALDQVNPTPHDLADDEREERYALKARLQSRLVRDFPNDLELRLLDDGVVLALKGGRDAKHVVRSRLDPSVQDWVGRELTRLQIDRLPEEAPAPPEPTPRAPSRTADSEDLLAAGDFHGAVDLLATRARGGDPAAAARWLEVLMEYLDDPGAVATAVAALPVELARRDAIVGLSAVALVRSGQLEQAERELRRIGGPASATAWSEIGALRLRAGDASGVRRAAERLLAADPGRRVAVEQLVEGAAKVVRAQLADELRSLSGALERHDWDAVERTADAIRARDPGNREARSALADLDRARRGQAGRAAFDDAARHERAERWRDAAARFRDAAAAGLPEASGRADDAQRRADLEEHERTTARVLAALRAEPRRGLTDVQAVPDAARAAVRERADRATVRLLDWLDLLPTARAEARADAALALAEASDALADRPAEALERVQPHLHLVERARGGARALLAAIRQGVEIAERQRAAALLSAVVESDAGDFAQLRRRIAQVDQRRLDEADRARLADLERQVTAQELEAARVAQFERLLLQDPLAARAMATGEDPAWSWRREVALEAVRGAYRVHDLVVDAPPSDLVPGEVRPGAHVGLDRAGQSCWIAEHEDEWVFLNELRVGEPRVGRALAFHLPDRLLGRRVHLDGSRMWFHGSTGAVRVDLEHGVPCERLVAAQAKLEVVPSRGGVWARPFGGRWSWRGDDGATHVGDDDLQVLVTVPGARADAVAQTRDGAIVELWRTGRRRVLLEASRGAVMVTACTHPVDRDAFLVVLYRPSEDRVDIYGIFAHGARPFSGASGPGIGGLTYATSRATGLFYTLHADVPGLVLKAIEPSGQHRFVAAFETAGELYTDSEGERVALVLEAREGLHVVLLGDQVPEVPPLPPLHRHPPGSDRCGSQLPDELAALAPQDFAGIGELLAGLDVRQLPVERRQHTLHLRALSSLARGDLAAARRDVAAARAETGDCEFAGLETWFAVVEASTPSAPDAPSNSIVRSWWEIRRALAAASGALARGDVSEATGAFAACAAACQCLHPQVTGTRARVLLGDPATPFWARCRGLTRLDCYPRNPPVPPVLSRDARRELVEAAAAWLEGPATEAVPRVARLVVCEQADGTVCVRHEAAFGVDLGDRQVRRSAVWEAEVARRFAAELGAEEVVLSGEAATRFLAETLPALSARWEVQGTGISRT